MPKTNRRWEVWDKENVERLARGWSNPEDLPHDSFSEDGSHWSLIQSVCPLIEGESVLDVACGMGHLFTLVKDRFEYLGVDTSQPMLKKAREFFPQDEDKFQFGDVYDLSMLPDFDTVVALGLILHLPESEPALTQLWNRARICTILSAWIGKTPLLWKRAPSPRSLKQFILREHFILRRETVEELGKIFDRLPNLDRVEEIPFHNPNPGESNYIFKLWKKGNTDD